jgi:predicted lipoprotein with Yx(FWY)xxD motif
MRHPRVIIAGLGLAAVAVRSAPAGVAGSTETILVNAQGLPLYFYRPDTATKSVVTAGLTRPGTRRPR